MLPTAFVNSEKLRKGREGVLLLIMDAEFQYGMMKNVWEG